MTKAFARIPTERLGALIGDKGQIKTAIEERTGVMTSIFTGYKNIRPHSTADYLTDRPGIGDDARDARTIAQQSGPRETPKTDA